MQSRQRRLLLIFVVALSVVGGLVSLRMMTGAHIEHPESRERPAASDRGPPEGVSVGAAAPTSGDEGSGNIRSFFEIKSAALGGDPVAQRRLSELYEDCLPYSLNRNAYLSEVGNLIERNPATAAAARRLLSERVAQCDAVDDGQPIPSDAYRLWLEQSANRGDLIAEIRLTSRSVTSLDPDYAARLLERARSSRDPNALLELSSLVGRFPEGAAGELAGLVGNPHAEFGWMIAACRAGADCGPKSRLMTSMCLGMGVCGDGGYEALILAQFPAPTRRYILEVANQLKDKFKG